jgi:sugar (pentulose or hexulose) kinase
VDLGSTGIKVLVTDEDGAEVVTSQVATPWRLGTGGATEMDAASVLEAVLRVITAAAEDVAELTDAKIDAIAISGMGETGILIDDRRNAVTSAIAWFDPRGAEQAEAFSPSVRAGFAGHTGLPLGAQVTVSKLAYFRDNGLPLAGLRWLNLPEFAAMALGGRVALEHSLTSRTGLIEQDSGQPWTAMLHELGCDRTLLPPMLAAGTSFGSARSVDLPRNVRGALLTVAGHDHLVAAEANGPLAKGHYHVSMGTAEVLLRVVDHPLGYEVRARLADNLINEVRHVVPGKHVLVAGVKSGLLMRRILQATGINDRVGRDRLDSDVINLPYAGHAAGAIELSGARNDDGVLQLAVRGDGVSPAEIFAAALRHTNEEIARLIEAIDRELPPAQTSTLTGGWVGMAAVRRARQRVLPNMTVSTREQETAFGAARVASRLLPSAANSL